jgi:hypothetical protein
MTNELELREMVTIIQRQQRFLTSLDGFDSSDDHIRNDMLRLLELADSINPPVVMPVPLSQVQDVAAPTPPSVQAGPKVTLEPLPKGNWDDSQKGCWNPHPLSGEICQRPPDGHKTHKRRHPNKVQVECWEDPSSIPGGKT